jgi:hypothetical protein
MNTSSSNSKPSITASGDGEVGGTESASSAAATRYAILR